MPDVPALSQAAANARATPEAEPEAQEGAPEAPSTIPVHTAFVVFQTVEGDTLVTPDINAPFVLTRAPSRDEMYGMLATALKDISATEVAGLSAQATAPAAAEAVVTLIEGKQRDAMKAAQDAMIKQQLNQGGGIRG